MKIGEIIKNYRAEHRLSQRTFAAQCEVSNGYISMLEEGKNPKTGEPIIPSVGTLKKIASAMGMSLGALVGEMDGGKSELAAEDIPLADNIFRVEMRKFPLIGEIACGEPIFADEDHESYIMASSEIHADFCLVAKGDSMSGARICDGDVVFIKKQPIVENGEIAAVIIGSEATLKRWYYYPDQKKLVLTPENASYEPFVYVGDELCEVRCIGKAVCFMSRL